VAPTGEQVAAVAVVGAYAAFAALSGTLAVIDTRTHRLPNRLVLPAYPVALVLLAIAALARPDLWALGRAILAGAVLFAFYLMLRLIQPSGMGGGDVKLAGLVGLMLGFAGWDAVALGVFAGFLSGGLYSIVLLARRRADRRTAVPFGPWMLLGAWVGLAAHLAAG
jgi:leader peptidase (prepilin peptidase)/N-methyltransferase